MKPFGPLLSEAVESIAKLRGMKNGVKYRRAFYLLVILFKVWTCSAETSRDELWAITKKFETNRPPAGTTWTLATEWVGVIETKVQNGWPGLEAREKFRFDHAAVMIRWPKTNDTRLFISTKLGDRGFIRTTEYQKSLPTVEKLKAVKSLDELRTLVGDPDSMDHGSVFWSLFTMEGENRLRALSIVAQDPTWGPDYNYELNLVREGIFGRANVLSANEIKEFKTGDELLKEMEAKTAERIATFPEPLRSIMKLEEDWKDREEAGYRSALNEFRMRPTAELMNAFAASIDDGTRQTAGIVDDYFFDARDKLKPWDEGNRLAAARYLARALPHAKNGLALLELLEIAVELQGGGRFEVSQNGAKVVAFEVKRTPGGGRWKSIEKFPDDDLPRVAEVCRDALLERFPALR